MTLQQPDAILTKMQGQSVVLPDLNAIFDGWPRGVIQNLEQLRRDVDGWLGRYTHQIHLLCHFSSFTRVTCALASAMKHSRRLESLKAADLGCWGASWWPQAKYERLKVATFLVAWVCVLFATSTTWY